MALAAVLADRTFSRGAEPPKPETPAQAPLFEDFDDSEGYPTAEALRSLLASVPGERAEIGRAHKWERPISRISGLFRLAVPWPAGSALRLSILDPERLQIHVWSGTWGATVCYYPEYHQTWALYSTTRQGAGPRAREAVLAATAGDRYRRAGFGTVQLEHHDGKLVLLRGDLVLASAPLAGPPTEVFIEGSGLVRGLAVVGSQWLPAGERASLRKPALRVIRPADWTWESSLPKGVALGRLPDGRVVLSAGEKTQQGQAAIAIENPGFAEFTFDVEDPEPGTGVYLGDAQGRHLCRLAFLRHRETGQVAFELLPGYASDSEKSYDIQRQVVPLAGRRQWYRIVSGAGLFTGWTSPDGLSWSQVGPTSVEAEGACGQVGLYCLAGDKKRSIALRRLEVRRLESIHAAAPAEVQKQVGNLAKLDSLEKWASQLARSAPPGVAPDVWWRACAVKTLADGPKPALARPLWDQLQRAVYASATDADACLRFAEEASMFYHQGDWASMDRLTAEIAPLGMALVRLKHPAPFSALHRSMLSWPVWHIRRLPAYPDQLLRAELVARVGEARWGEVQDLCRRLEYFNRTGGPRTQRISGEQPPWSEHGQYVVEWAEAVAAAQLPKPKDAKPAGYPLGARPALGRHPLIENPTPEGFGIASQLRAALENQDFREAAQTITSMTNYERLGLVPDWADPWLLTSLPAMTAAAARDKPALAKSIQELAAAVGPLRLRQAVAGGNPAAVEAVAYQFPGTELAAAAHRWLGDRETSMGRFVEAMAQYRRSYASASPTDREALLARARLLGALCGVEVGQAPRAPIRLGGMQFSPAEFEQMLDPLRQARAAGYPPDAQPPSAVAYRPGRYEARYCARLEGHNVKRPSGYPDRGVDWAGRQIAVQIADGRMVVNNRIEQTAFGLATGKPLWANRLDVEEGKQQWASLPMQPVVTAGEVFCRRLTNKGPELLAVDSGDGRLFWSAHPDDAVVSDPLFVGDRLFVLCTTTDPGSKITLNLMGLDLSTGRVRSRVPLAEFRDLWRGQLPCQAEVVEEKIVAVVGGCVLCCTPGGYPAGRVQWLRRQPWIPPSSFEYSSGREWIDPCYSPPVVASGTTGTAGRVFATQPGVWAVECMDLESGRLVWRQALGGLLRLLGQAKGRLALETADGLVGLDPESGRVVWWQEVGQRLDTVLCGPQGPVLTAHLGAKKDGGPAPIMLSWIDPQSGRRLGRSVLKPPSLDPSVRLGEGWLKPLVAAEGRLWAFWAPLQEPAKREILELVRVGEADQGPEGEEP